MDRSTGAVASIVRCQSNGQLGCCLFVQLRTNKEPINFTCALFYSVRMQRGTPNQTDGPTSRHLIIAIPRSSRTYHQAQQQQNSNNTPAAQLRQAVVRRHLNQQKTIPTFDAPVRDAASHLQTLDKADITGTHGASLLCISNGRSSVSLISRFQFN